MGALLEPDASLAVGDVIAVRAWEMVAGELLARQPATMYADLDL